MDANLCYDGEQNLYLVYRGNELLLQTASYRTAIDLFDKLCDQARSV